ncbi:MAG: hypothetical protein HY964_10565 [Ignavibacteriales bacterium]|nr:hypothetical protein [Ignavibacteriales bacterium]
MITLFVFYIHVIATVILFTKRWQEEGWKEGILAVGFLGLIFGVGWSMSTFVLKLFMSEKGFGVWFDRDAISLVLLLVIEAIFFSIQLRRKKRKAQLA